MSRSAADSPPPPAGGDARAHLIDRLAPSWLVMQLFGTVVLLGALATSRESRFWMWSLYCASLVCWLVYLVSGRRFPRFAWIELAVGTLLAAATLGHADDVTASVLASVLIGRFTALAGPPARVITMVVILAVSIPAVTTLATGRSTSELITYVALLLTAALLGLNRRQYLLRLVQTEELLAETRQRRAEEERAAALGERARIAREIHDVLAHSLGALGVQLQVVETLLEQNRDVDTALVRVRRSQELAREGVNEARRAVAVLRGDVPELSSALAELVAAHRHDHLVAVRAEVEGLARALPKEVATSLIMVAREALTNAARHAPGAEVTITLSYRPGSVRLRVRNGIPAAPGRTAVPRTHGYGLVGMRERVALVGGTLTAGPLAGQAWQVEAELPG
ncbi:signal transduction histidine kinase [Actinoplanes octamycinicus]|uniref:histidine kinase n=1 Tax=Actinoplanes octamycinicus TaxID=135948 RepID=A0A7W7M807_9ACTN|nr:sensor histidine kinase [Actinoplanes octamycinicus]MBB4740389.1 signal transduction histidine kinase [Actinoplanes octamycinicus]GIE59650.1 hypothetical protein Aoc01nite_50520 [Actinoplanes octamycinicus]